MVVTVATVVIDRGNMFLNQFIYVPQFLNQNPKVVGQNRLIMFKLSHGQMHQSHILRLTI